MAEKRIKIASIRIKNFRSIRNETITAKDFNIFVGLNDAGKSNVLKALNLFFTGETDYGKKFSFENDFSYLFPKTSHSTKEIRITIKFEIPDTYTDSGEYTWTKVWRTGSYFEESIVESTDVRDTILSFEPKSLKKKRILELLKGTDDKKSATVGLLRTVQKIESYFCGNQLTQ